MTAEAFHEIFKATLPKKEQDRFMRILDKDTTPLTTTLNTTNVRHILLNKPKLKIPNVG